MNTTATILKAARDLIAKPENWTQGEYARTSDYGGTVPYDRGAICFCSVGAISKVVKIDPTVQCIPFDVVKMLGFQHEADLIKFNDSHRHSEVLDLFSKAIKAAEGEQS